MGLEIKPESQWWYARFRVGGKIKQVRLDVRVEGERPARLKDDGDRAFERSRGAALKEFKLQVEKLRGDPMAEKTLQRLVEIKTGHEAKFPKLADLPVLWEAIPRRRDPNDRYKEQCKGGLKRFAEFVAEQQPMAAEFVKVTPETAKAFMGAESARGLSPKTWNDTLKLLRTTFKRLHPQLNDGSNPFHGLITKATATVNREPFSIPEMKAILEASVADPAMRLIIVTGMCTAMRRGDCCMLKWDDVDLKQGFISVKTSKTGETVDIPMFPMLREMLREIEAKGQKGPFCFPEAAAMYEKNPDGITWRVKRILAAAFRSRAVEDGKGLPVLPADEVRRRGLAYLDTLGTTNRAARMRKVFELYMAGKDINDVMAESGQSRGSVSGHLNDIEQHTQCAFIRGKVRGTAGNLLQEARANGARRASVRDFHSFRVTWITLALAAGVPLEIVQRVTGHRTVEIVLKHYFRPGREDFRRTLENAMPRLFMESAQPKALPASVVKEEGTVYQPLPTPGDMLQAAIESLEKMTAKNWKAQRDEALTSVRAAAKWIGGNLVFEETTGKGR
jgi:integrase